MAISRRLRRNWGTMSRRLDQWFTNQAGQRDFLADASRWSAYFGGWGSGKTWAGARKHLLNHQMNNCPGLAMAPTWGDVWRIVVPALTEACASVRWPCRTVRGVAPHLLVGKYPIWLLSGDAPERITGIEVGHIWLDEGARVATSSDPLRDAPTQMRGRLRNPAAKRLQGIITTTHEGTGSWVYQDFISKAKPGHRAHKGRTSANRALPPEYLADRLATLPAALKDQYLDGEAVDFSKNRAHPGFSLNRHLAAREIDPALPLHVGMDFNVSPLCWVLGQVRNGDDRAKATVHIVDELVVDDHSTIEGAMAKAHEKGWGKAGAVHLHPDRSANNRSTVGNPIAFLLAEQARAWSWPYAMHSSGANPPVNARIALVDGLVEPYLGPPRLTVHPRCVRLARELSSVGRLTSGPYDPGRDGQFGHILDALGYLIWDELRPGSGFASA